MNTGIFIIIIIAIIGITLSFIKYCDVKDSEKFYEYEALVDDRKNYYEIKYKSRYLMNGLRVGVSPEDILALFDEDEEDDFDLDDDEFNDGFIEEDLDQSVDDVELFLLIHLPEGFMHQQERVS